MHLSSPTPPSFVPLPYPRPTPPTHSSPLFILRLPLPTQGLRLAQQTNKCANGEEDLEYYIAESGEILGVMNDLPFGERSAKHILFHIFKQVGGGRARWDEVWSLRMVGCAVL